MRDLTLDVDGPVHVVDHGGEGPPMLLVHGLAGSYLNWMDVALPLARHHHVWSLDLIGFGHTPLEGRHATIGENQQLVDRVAEHVGGGEPVLLVGNSMGGLISILEAASNPARVAGLVLVDPALPSPTGGRLSLMIAASFLVLTTPAIGTPLINARARMRGAERMVDDALALCTVDVRRIAPATRDAHVELNRWHQAQGYSSAAFVEASRSLVRWLLTTSKLEPYVQRVSAPTLLIHGDGDRLVSVRASGALAVQRPDWDFRVMTDTGHIPMMERPAEFITLVERWLDDVAPRLGAGRQPAELTPASTSRR